MLIGSIKFTPHGIISLSISFVIAGGLLGEAFSVSFRSQWGAIIYQYPSRDDFYGESSLMAFITRL